MNTLIFTRLLWKEYRLQRGFWLSIAALACLLMLLVLAVAWRGEPPPVDELFAIGLGAASLYALGSGATLFATEHEAGTYGFLPHLAPFTGGPGRRPVHVCFREHTGPAMGALVRGHVSHAGCNARPDGTRAVVGGELCCEPGVSSLGDLVLFDPQSAR